MADVARHAGVSSQTVSRVSNGHSNVEELTRQRVLASMSELGYRPNRAARALRSGKFRSIGVIMFTLSTAGNMSTLEAIGREAALAGYSITLLPVVAPTAGDVSGAYNRLSEQAVDGIVIVYESHLMEHAAFTPPTGMPVVVIDSNPDVAYPVVDTDQQQGARAATRHLLELGHPTVHHVAGPANSFSATHRAEAWAAELGEAGIRVPPMLMGDWSTDSGYRHGLDLAQNHDVTAIFAANDQMALGVMRAFHEVGRDIPGDVSIVGFDDLEESSSFWPPLTTVHQNFAQVGRLAVQLLLASIDTAEPIARSSTLVPTTLVVRASTALHRATP